MDDELYRLHAEREETYWWWVAKNRIILSLIERYGPPRPSPRADAGGTEACSRRLKTMDIGCGAGGVLARLAERFDAVGVDMSPIAREYCAKRGLKALDGSLPDHLPVREEGQFDVVVMSEVLEHVVQDRESVREVVRLVRSGGIIVCTVPAHMWLWSAHDDFNEHQRRYTRAQFGALWDGLPVQTLLLSYANTLGLIPLAATRLLGRLLASRPLTPEVRSLPRPLNSALRCGFEAEKWLLPHVRLPWGSSVVAVYRRV